MINKLHLAMIELYRGDSKRIQHFCKVHSYAKLIAETENVDKKCLFTIEAAAEMNRFQFHGSVLRMLWMFRFLQRLQIQNTVNSL